MAMTDLTGSESLDVEWTLGDRVRKVRRCLRMEQKEFGQLFGKTDKAVSRWENDHGFPKDVLAFARHLEDIAQAHGLRWCSAAWLLTGGFQLRAECDLTVLENPFPPLPGLETAGYRPIPRASHLSIV